MDSKTYVLAYLKMLKAIAKSNFRLYLYIDSILSLNANRDHLNTTFDNKMMTNDFIYIVLA
ncbi:hypothetical protein OAU_04710 [Vibrio cyclitrophicus ZF99]|nr:hypothetical protein OAU_04710 [Vibrio cyclitrophicus ZF99]PME71258.1 hypothetical protein BCV31_18375 [Vibrio cyclitrophicus]PME73549.1 hypothetical protein BCV29_20420 [Vibrio cyclitrophicus]PMK99003.1 hypothetical protein BCT87_04865 [Vibrio cyclitrophicus]